MQKKLKQLCRRSACELLAVQAPLASAQSAAAAPVENSATIDAGEIVAIGVRESLLPIYTEAYGWLDASVGYRYSERISLVIEGTNLLGTTRRSYYGVDTRPQSNWVNDVQIGATVTVRFK